MSAGLEASTVTPGSTAPDVSFTTPVIDACASTEDGSRTSTDARRIADRTTTLIHPSAYVYPLPTFTRSDLGW